MEPFIGQIIMFGGNFAIRGWAFCDGQLLPISQYSALFSLIGTTYGGDGRTTFALPDLRSRVAIHRGAGPGLTNRPQGQTGGSETNRLTTNQLPSHNHGISSATEGTSKSPVGKVLAVTDDRNYVDGPATGVTQNAGLGLEVNNMPPYGTVNYIIALQGVFPSRS